MRVLNILRSRFIEFSVYDHEYSPPYFSVLYTDHSYFLERVRNRSDVAVFYDPQHSCRVLEGAILATKFKNKYNELAIGIDPGRKPYVVVLGDEEILEHGYINMDDLKSFVDKCISCYPHENVVVRVGGGYDGWAIALRLKESLDVRIEVVDEIETTPKAGNVDDPIHIYLTNVFRTRNKDAYAALKIALRRGIEVS